MKPLPPVFSMQNRIDELRSLLRAEPGSRRFFQLGDLLRKIGSYDEAGEVLRTGLEHHPRYTAAWISLGRVQLEQEDFQEAEASFARSLELDAENSVSAHLLGDTALAAGEYVRAIKAYKLARALGDPELDDRIEEVQFLIWDGDGRGEPETPVSRHESPEAADEGEVFPEGVAPEETPFEEDREDPTLSVAVASPRSRPSVVFVRDEDPFGIDDTEFPELEGGDVFASASEEVPPTEESVGDDVFGSATAAAGPSSEGEDAEPAPEEAVVDESVIPTPIAAAEEAFAEEPQEPSAAGEGMSIPTLTLARLAWKQGDAAMAESTLRLLLVKDSENADARALLEEIGLSAEPEDEAIPAPVAVEAEPAVMEVPAEEVEALEEIHAVEETRDVVHLSGDELLKQKIAILGSWAENIRRASGGTG